MGKEKLLFSIENRSFWSCWADSNRRPHPYQVIKCSPAVAVQGFAGIFTAKRMRSKTLCSMCSTRSFPRVGQGVGQRRKEQRCGSTFGGAKIVPFCAAVDNKRALCQKHRTTGQRKALPPDGSLFSLYVSRMGQNVGQSFFNSSKNDGSTSYIIAHITVQLVSS